MKSVVKKQVIYYEKHAQIYLHTDMNGDIKNDKFNGYYISMYYNMDLILKKLNEIYKEGINIDNHNYTTLEIYYETLFIQQILRSYDFYV